MKSFTPLVLLAFVSSATALPAWFGEVSPSSSGAVQSSGYANSSLPVTPPATSLSSLSSLPPSSSSAPSSSSSVSTGVYTLPYTPHSTSTHSFVYVTSIYGPTAPHTHKAYSLPKIYTDVETGAASTATAA